MSFHYYARRLTVPGEVLLAWHSRHFRPHSDDTGPGRADRAEKTDAR